MRRLAQFIPWICLLTLLLAALACSYPGLEDAQQELNLPTAEPSPAPEDVQPTEAPTPAPEADPPVAPVSAYPITLQASGSKLAFNSTGEASCDVPDAFTLTLLADGTAQLSATGPSIVDHINCTQSTDETWIANGKFDETSQTVTFESCNFGNFRAEGSLSYGMEPLSGGVSCFGKDGAIWVRLVVGE
jgi:hypothetical protein